MGWRRWQSTRPSLSSPHRPLIFSHHRRRSAKTCPSSPRLRRPFCLQHLGYRGRAGNATLCGRHRDPTAFSWPIPQVKIRRNSQTHPKAHPDLRLRDPFQGWRKGHPQLEAGRRFRGRGQGLRRLRSSRPPNRLRGRRLLVQSRRYPQRLWQARPKTRVLRKRSCWAGRAPSVGEGSQFPPRSPYAKELRLPLPSLLSEKSLGTVRFFKQTTYILV